MINQRLRVGALALGAFLVGGPGVAASDPSAQTLQLKESAAEPRADDKARIAAVEKQLDQLPDRGAALYYVAVLTLHAGDVPKALRFLKECLALQEGFDPSGSPPFGRLISHVEGFNDLVAKVHRKFPAVVRAHLAFVTGEKDLVPEGLAYDARQNAFYLSSLNRRKIIRIAADGVTSDFVPEERDGLLPVLGIRPDPRDGTVWANSWSDDSGRSELLHFSASGKMLGRYALGDSPKHGFNDLVIRPGGNVVLTDSLSNQVLAFNPSARTFEPLAFHRVLAEPNGIALSGNDRYLFVADDFGIVRLDLASGASVDVNPGPHNTLAGVDGLYWHKGSLIAIQNGIGSPRIAAFRLSRSGARVTNTTVLEYRSPFMTGEPTTGAIRGDMFYFIANSQVENMNRDQVADATKLERVRIGVLRLP